MSRLLCVLGALLIAAPAAAHQDTVAHSRMVIRADGSVEYALRIPVEDLAETLGRPGHTALNAPEVRGAEQQLFEHFLPLIGMSSGGTPCPVDRGGVDVPEDERLYGELRFRFSCPPGAPVTVDYRVFFAIDPGHVGMLEVEGPGGSARAEFILEKPRWEVSSAGEGPPQVRAVDEGAAAPPPASTTPAGGRGSTVAAPAERAREANPIAPVDTSLPAGREGRGQGHSPGYWMPVILVLIVVAAAGVFYAARRRRSPSAR